MLLLIAGLPIALLLLGALIWFLSDEPPVWFVNASSDKVDVRAAIDSIEAQLSQIVGPTKAREGEHARKVYVAVMEFCSKSPAAPGYVAGERFVTTLRLLADSLQARLAGIPKGAVRLSVLPMLECGEEAEIVCCPQSDRSVDNRVIDSLATLAKRFRIVLFLRGEVYEGYSYDLAPIGVEVLDYSHRRWKRRALTWGELLTRHLRARRLPPLGSIQPTMLGGGQPTLEELDVFHALKELIQPNYRFITD